MIQVQGALVDPMNNPSTNTVIRVKALDTEVSLMGMEASTKTDSSGMYDFNLVVGQHQIEINWSDEYKTVERVEVTVTTTTPISLAALITGSAIP